MLTPSYRRVLFFVSLICMTDVGCKSISGDSDLLKSHDDGEVTLQARRFYGPIERLSAIVEKTRTSPQDATDIFNDNDGRMNIMQIEALTDLYKDNYKSQLKDVDKLASDFSDELSAFNEANGFLVLAQSVGAPANVLEFLAKKQKKTKDEYAQYLKDKGWLKDLDDKDQPLSMMRKVVTKKVAWDKPGKDAQYIIKQLIADLNEIQTKNFDFNDLDNGLHKFRRYERWIFIKMKVSDGLFQGDRNYNPIPQYISALSDAGIPTKYSELTNNVPVAHPVRVSQSLISYATGLIENIGTAKDYGLTLGALTEAFKDSGLSASASEAQARALVLKYPAFQAFKVNPSLADASSTDFVAKAREIYNEFIQKVNPELLRELQAGAATQ